MKNFSILFVGFFLLISGFSAGAYTGSDNKKELQSVQTEAKTIQISVSQDLHALAMNWVTDYNKSNPVAKISLDRNLDSIHPVGDQLRLVTDENSPALKNSANWRMVIGRDVIVGIVGSSNPMLKSLDQNGVSRDMFSLLLSDPSRRNWSSLMKQGQDIPIQLFLPQNDMIKSDLEAFAKTKINTSGVITLSDPNQIIEAVQKNANAIGFCKLNDLRAKMWETGKEQIRLLPIDKNGNGRLDNFEKIYSNLDEFTHGVWIGKYPNALSNNVYAVQTTQPTDKNELAFLSWIMADGQKALNSNGYCDLTSSEKRANLAILANSYSGEPQSGQAATAPKSWPVYLTLLVIGAIFALLFFKSRRSTNPSDPQQEISIAPLFIENAIDVPKGLYFDKTHTWAFMEKEGNVRIGMDDFLQHITGKLTKIKMKEVGENVRKGEKIVTIIRDGKQLNLYAPISGTIAARNNSLLSDSAIVNSSPYSDGWVYQIEPKNWLREVQFMFMGEKYSEWLKDEFVRLKDFIASSVKTNELAYAHVVLQDGGELSDNVLADLGPEVWEDFQTQFIDLSR